MKTYPALLACLATAETNLDRALAVAVDPVAYAAASAAYNAECHAARATFARAFAAL